QNSRPLFGPLCVHNNQWPPSAVISPLISPKKETTQKLAGPYNEEIASLRFTCQNERSRLCPLWLFSCITRRVILSMAGFTFLVPEGSGKFGQASWGPLVCR